MATRTDVSDRFSTYLGDHALEYQKALIRALEWEMVTSCHDRTSHYMRVVPPRLDAQCGLQAAAADATAVWVAVT